MIFQSFCEGGGMLSYAVEGCLSKMHILQENRRKGGRIFAIKKSP